MMIGKRFGIENRKAAERSMRRKICKGSALTALMAAAMMLLCACGKKTDQAPVGAAPGEAAPAAEISSESAAAEVAEEQETEAEEQSTSEENAAKVQEGKLTQMEELSAALTPLSIPEDDPERTTYEVFVYSFYDSDGNGIGDLNGLRQKLDYIGGAGSETGADPGSGIAGLGCSEIWMMPVFPSPTYHKYDVTDYMAIDPQYGTMEDFDALLAECHARGIRLILDLAINHTSTEHPWFQEAAAYLRELPDGQEPSFEDCSYVSYYNFQREPAAGYAQLKDSGWYYECRFWEGMPDLNLDQEAVREEIRKIAAFWLEKGVDGFRLDAVTSYYTDMHEQNVEFLRWFNTAVKEISPDAYLVGEAWENQNIYARYYESGMDSLFDFAFAGQDGLIANVVRGSRPASAYAEALVREEELFGTANPEYINAPFYPNHDMARSTGYYAYDDGSRTKLAGALNLLMPGNAFLYYGEELGMKGSGKDENKRAPMQWTGNAEAEGMCRGPEAMDSFSMKFPPLEEQAEDPLSIYNYFRTAIRIRNSFPAISHGRTRILGQITGKETCGFVREMPEDSPSELSYEPVCVVMNLSETEQTADLAGTGYESGTLAAVLTVSEAPVQVNDSRVTLPPFSIAIFTAEE